MVSDSSIVMQNCIAHSTNTTFNTTLTTKLLNPYMIKLRRIQFLFIRNYVVFGVTSFNLGCNTVTSDGLYEFPKSMWGVDDFIYVFFFGFKGSVRKMPFLML